MEKQTKLKIVFFTLIIIAASLIIANIIIFSNNTNNSSYTPYTPPIYTYEVLPLTVNETYENIESWGCRGCAHVIDVRTVGEYEYMHMFINNSKVNGPVNIDYSKDFSSAIITYDNENNKYGAKHDTYFIYSKDGSRSALASQWMIDNNFTVVYDMIGGLDEWFNTGLPLIEG